MRKMFRYEVPIDDRSHEFLLTNSPVAVDMRSLESRVLEFWAENDSSKAGTIHRFQVYGTGHELPKNVVHVGTCRRILGLVFHLYEYVGPTTKENEQS